MKEQYFYMMIAVDTDPSLKVDEYTKRLETEVNAALEDMRREMLDWGVKQRALAWYG